MRTVPNISLRSCMYNQGKTPHQPPYPREDCKWNCGTWSPCMRHIEARRTDRLPDAVLLLVLRHFGLGRLGAPSRTCSDMCASLLWFMGCGIRVELVRSTFDQSHGRTCAASRHGSPAGGSPYEAGGSTVSFLAPQERGFTGLNIEHLEPDDAVAEN